MAIIRVVFCIFFALIAGGCSQIVNETLHVPPDAPSELACPKTVVVLPFADYFYTDDIRTGLIRNSIVMEYLVDRLVAKGVSVPVQEDVLQYLKDKNIVTLLPPEDESRFSDTSSLAWELTGDWSSTMKEEIKRIIALEAGRAPLEEERLLKAPGIYALDRESIQALGDFFDADYLVRGRIIEYYLKKGSMKGIAYTPPQAVIHLRVWVQSTATGEVVWTNRAEVKVSAQSEFVDDSSALFETALSRAATTLINDFWTRINS
jgi:hypothetical protein